ncbi:hypothetical protein CCACVL1_20776 [Corchorus capsularis]|uniref:Uncharacterized protein n=1 Tax=Corchorus capsularis TaxID=210143 RepID=A0A1R3H9V2_COCAP|nr:hypothetical protein CCACVL1_20776 [Corchorus capsularis]
MGTIPCERLVDREETDRGGKNKKASNNNAEYDD